MYISLNWLQDFIKIPAKISAQDIAEQLTAHTVEVEGFFDQADKFKQVVVGKVLEIKKHPNADKLRIALVDIKTKKLNIVCGATNLAEGQLVPVAMEGAILPGEFLIKTSNIRGELSEGMICAEDELGLGDDHEGIMVLDSKAKIGQKFADYLGLKDIIFEVDNKSLSNRPDLFSHYGLVRELATIFDLRYKNYNKIIIEKDKIVAVKDGKLKVDVVDKNLCPRYLAVKIDNIKIEESPLWLKNKLIAINQRPINNIVDLTNYVMLECGQPLHAFDANKIKQISIRLANKNETVETLDNKERILTNNDLVITDGVEPIAIAGIMGCHNAEIKEKTNSIILEAANFKADNIRRTSQRLGLRTEASVRFEKSLDPELAEDAMGRFFYLLKEICPSAQISTLVFDSYNKKIEEINIFLDFHWLTQKIGQEIPVERVISILNNLGFKVVQKDGGLEVVVPSWRATKDVKSREDLVEEILRIYGYNNIISFLPTEQLVAPEMNYEKLIERKIKDILFLRFNLMEVYNYSFVGEDNLKKLNIDFFNHLKLINPLSGIYGILRQSLVPGLVLNIKNNQFKDDELGFFEIGGVFFNAPGDFKRQESGETKLPYQEKKIGIVITSLKKNVFAEIKSLVHNFLLELVGQSADLQFSAFDNIPGWAHKSTCAKISIGKEDFGLISILNKEVIDGFNLKTKVGVVELNFNKLIKVIFNQPDLQFNETPKYPPVIRDISFVISNKILYNDIRQEISVFNDLIKTVELLDVYEGDKLAKGEKNLTFRLYYQASDKTLVSTEVDEMQGNLMNRLQEKFDTKIRDF